jgi:Pyruvate formate lyase-like
MGVGTARTLSEQEQAIESGNKVLHGTVTDRVQRMYEAIRTYGPPRVTLDRAVLFTESFTETENQPLVLRWAKALKHFAEKVPATIFPDDSRYVRPDPCQHARRLFAPCRGVHQGRQGVSKAFER